MALCFICLYGFSSIVITVSVTENIYYNIELMIEQSMFFFHFTSLIYSKKKDYDERLDK